MKKHICRLIAFLLCLMFVSCDPKTSDNNSSAPENSVGNTSISETQSTDESKDVSEPATEESNVSGLKPPPADPEDFFPCCALSAHSAKEYADKLMALKTEINGSDKLDSLSASCYANLDSLIDAGYIFNPSYDGVYAENENKPENSSTIESVFWDDGFISIVYYCKNDNDAIVRVQVGYPNESMANLIKEHGIDGFRMYCSDSKQPLSKYSAEEIAALGYESVKIVDADFGGKTYSALKYINHKDSHINVFSFMYEGKVISISYKYMDESTGKNPDDILKLIKLEKIELK